MSLDPFPQPKLPIRVNSLRRRESDARVKVQRKPYGLRHFGADIEFEFDSLAWCEELEPAA